MSKILKVFLTILYNSLLQGYLQGFLTILRNSLPPMISLKLSKQSHTIFFSSRISSTFLSPAGIFFIILSLQGYSSQGYLSQYDSPQGLENTSFSAVANNDEHSINKRRTLYIDEECEVLAKYWIDVSVDSVIGNDQRIRRVWGSGKSDADILEMTQTDCKQHHGTQGFKCLNVWRILSEQPKFDIQALKRCKSNEVGAYTSSSNASEAATSRPMGQKAMKRKVKGKEKKEGGGVSTEIIQAHETNATKLIILKADELGVKANEVCLKEYEIIIRDTSTMTNMQLCTGIV